MQADIKSHVLEMDNAGVGELPDMGPVIRRGSDRAPWELEADRSAIELEAKRTMSELP